MHVPGGGQSRCYGQGGGDQYQLAAIASEAAWWANPGAMANEAAPGTFAAGQAAAGAHIRIISGAGEADAVLDSKERAAVRPGAQLELPLGGPPPTQWKFRLDRREALAPGEGASSFSGADLAETQAALSVPLPRRHP